MRLFTAIELPGPAREHLARINDHEDPESVNANSGYRISLTRPENLHITLKFLGEVAEPKIAELLDALLKVEAEPSDEVWAGYMQSLPPRGRPRVMAAGLEGDTGRLELLYRDVERCCEDVGFPRERRPYHPHITLQRSRSLAPAGRSGGFLQRYAGYFPGPRFRVESFALFESRLHADAPEYIRLAHFPLNRGAFLS